MENSQQADTFRFFGDVWLEHRAPFLRDEDLAIFRQYMPMIERMDSEWTRRPRSNWDLTCRFERFVQEETEVWRQLGVERSNPGEFLLTPSGSINGPLAHHLLNPTFFVADPRSHDTDDLSNPTMSLLHDNGFSSGQECFFFDQFCRRTRTQDCLYFWTEEIQKPHDDFVRDIRRNMYAIVEILWGEHAWMKTKQQCDLIRFPLWGNLKEVKFYLEIESERLKRFVIWVHHPQFFFRPRRQTRTDGVLDRTIQARVQDTALAFAASLVGIQIDRNFYESHPRGKYPRLGSEQKQICEALESLSLVELEKAFPLKASQRRNRQVRDKGRYDKQERIREEEDLQMILKELENGQTIREEVQRDPEGKTLTNAHENTELWRSRQIQISDLIKSWFDVCRASKDNSLPAESYPDGSPLDDSSWFLLPPRLIEWLQSQDGLKIKGKEIESREDLERAFGLLRCDPKKLQNGCVDTSPIEEIAIEVGYKYTEYARLSRRKPIILEWTIPLPKVISRACASCKRPVLDDAFPYFAKNDQSFYILRTLQFTGCGLPGCEGSVVLVPWDKWQNSMKPNKPDLEKPLEQPNGRADWSSFFLPL